MMSTACRKYSSVYIDTASSQRKGTKRGNAMKSYTSFKIIRHTGISEEKTVKIEEGEKDV